MFTVVHCISFEHSLVQELGYNGYAQLRSAFNKAFGGEHKVPMFDVVIDAGCGTGLVGEQVRW
jgi:predicted TPR repeat methyltransferase